MDPTPAPTTDDADSSAPFLSVFDTPLADTPADPPAPNPLETPFDPEALVAEFRATAAAERKEQERIEQEIKGKLLELTQLKRQQQEHHASLAALSLDESTARQLPRRLTLLNELTRAFATQLPNLSEQGQHLEEQRAAISDQIKQLDRFLKDTNGRREAMIADFGGGQLGEQRFAEVEQRTRQALEQRGVELERIKQAYDQWQHTTLTNVQELLTELSLTARQDTLTVRTLATLATDIEQKYEALQSLGEQAHGIIDRLDVIDHAVDQLLADQRVAERLHAEEQAIADAHTSFVEAVVKAHKIDDREPTAVLLQKLARAFFQQALSQQGSERRDTPAGTATSISKSLVSTLGKMRQQPTIDFVRLAAHLKAQVALQEGATPSLTPATLGYNDLLVFGLMTGLIGNARQAFEPFAIEHTALGGQPATANEYLATRLIPFQPLIAILRAAHQAHLDTRAVKQQPAWPTWVADVVQLVEQSKVGTIANATDAGFKSALAEFATLLSSHASTQQAHAQQEANRIRLRLEELDQTQRNLTERYEHSQEQLKQHLSALSLVDDALELVQDLEQLIGQQQRFGLLPLARGNMKQHEEVEQRSKLLLLKLPDLRRAAELVSLDLGQVDVTDPAKLKPQFLAFKARIAQNVEQARAEQATTHESLRSLVELFDQVILGDKDFDLVIRSQWLPKEVSEQLFAQYRTVEQRYRQTIQTHNLRRAAQPS